MALKDRSDEIDRLVENDRQKFLNQFDDEEERRAVEEELTAATSGDFNERSAWGFLPGVTSWLDRHLLGPAILREKYTGSDYAEENKVRMSQARNAMKHGKELLKSYDLNNSRWRDDEIGQAAYHAYMMSMNFTNVVNFDTKTKTWWTVKETAEILGKDESQVSRLIKHEHLLTNGRTGSGEHGVRVEPASLKKLLLKDARKRSTERDERIKELEDEIHELKYY